MVGPDAPQLPTSARTGQTARRLCAPSRAFTEPPASPLSPRGRPCPTLMCCGMWTFQSLGCCVHCRHGLGCPSCPPASTHWLRLFLRSPRFPAAPGEARDTPPHHRLCQGVLPGGPGSRAPTPGFSVGLSHQLRDTQEPLPAARSACLFKGLDDLRDDDCQRFVRSAACTVMASL